MILLRGGDGKVDARAGLRGGVVHGALPSQWYPLHRTAEYRRCVYCRRVPRIHCRESARSYLGGRYAYAMNSTSSSVETYSEMNDATMLITAI